MTVLNPSVVVARCPTLPQPDDRVRRTERDERGRRRDVQPKVLPTRHLADDPRDAHHAHHDADDERDSPTGASAHTRDCNSERPIFVLIGSEGLWAADCLVPGCLWTTTAPHPEAADTTAQEHAWKEHQR